MASVAPRLIEVALPLDAINRASAREKSIRHGHPSTLHLWWARRPLAAARAVLFTSLVPDPDHECAPADFVAACRNLPIGDYSKVKDTPRNRLFDFIATLVKWESTTDEKIIGVARELIRIGCEGEPPPVLDPFAGGGSIPLEAQRLGLTAYASDLNPVAVLINKAMIEIPPLFAGQPPVNPRDRAAGTGGDARWRGAAGLAADVRYYGEWMRERAQKRIGHLYPKHKGETVIAWLWARTVQSPNPAVRAEVPLVNSFALSKKKGREYWAEPIIEQLDVSDGSPTHRVRFEVRKGKPPSDYQGTMVRRNGAICAVTKVPITYAYIKEQGFTGSLGSQLMAIVTAGKDGQNFHSPDGIEVAIAASAEPNWKPEGGMPARALGFVAQLYGFDEFHKLFTPRQLVALTTFSDLITETRARIELDAIASGLIKDGPTLRDITKQATGGLCPNEEGERSKQLRRQDTQGQTDRSAKTHPSLDRESAHGYAEALSVLLAFVVDRASDYWSSFCVWAGFIAHTFGRQAIPMVWDFAEGNPFSNSTGSWMSQVDWISRACDAFRTSEQGIAIQRDASSYPQGATQLILSTDPPYYDNIGYAALSDYFYIWLRRNLRNVYPDLFETLLVSKSNELVAEPARHKSKGEAKVFFENGMKRTFASLRDRVQTDFPVTIFYAYKQQDTGASENRQSSGWETMLNSLISSGFQIVGTWPMRTERSGRMRNIGSNALASSIVLVCRVRPDNAETKNIQQFLTILRQELPRELRKLTSGNFNLAATDLAQASIGPGMSIFSRYAQVVKFDKTPLTVRDALNHINRELDRFFSDLDNDLDPETRFAVTWFQDYGFDSGPFGNAEDLARALNIAVDSVERAGLVHSAAGKVALIHHKKYGDWSPVTDPRPTVWEGTHHLIRCLHRGGEEEAAELLRDMEDRVPADEALRLAYRLYDLCERKQRASHARDYNDLVDSWSEILRLANAAGPRQTEMDL